MLKEQIVERVYAAHGALTRREAACAVDALLDEIREALLAEGRVKLSGFGVFRAVQRKGKSGVHPSSGKMVEIKAHKTVLFSPSQNFLEALARGGAFDANGGAEAAKDD